MFSLLRRERFLLLLVAILAGAAACAGVLVYGVLELALQHGQRQVVNVSAPEELQRGFADDVHMLPSPIGAANELLPFPSGHADAPFCVTYGGKVVGNCTWPDGGISQPDGGVIGSTSGGSGGGGDTLWADAGPSDVGAIRNVNGANTVIVGDGPNSSPVTAKLAIRDTRNNGPMLSGQDGNNRGFYMQQTGIDIDYVATADACSGLAPDGLSEGTGFKSCGSGGAAFNWGGFDTKIDGGILQCGEGAGGSLCKTVVTATNSTAPIATQFGTAILSGGTVAVPFTEPFGAVAKCTCTDQTTAGLALKCPNDGTTITITGTGADHIDWICFGLRE